MGEGKGLVSLASTTCAEGICITSLNYTVARDKIKARKRCYCENIDGYFRRDGYFRLVPGLWQISCKEGQTVLGRSGNTSEQVTAKTSRSNIPATTCNCSGLIVPSSLNALARRYSLELGHG